MNTARIVVLTVAIGIGGIAAYLASESDGLASPLAAPVAQLPTVDILVAGQAEMLAHAHRSGALSLALRSIADVNAKNDNEDELARAGWAKAFRSFASAFRAR